ncbi:MAG: GTP 3',8-cyclase MoaA [Planctomycetes bacterium]|nr:GTP 3',8-cyclase MoaA [Planctomycetota bacterium]
MTRPRFPYLRLSLTRRCGLRCMYCKEEGPQDGGDVELPVLHLTEMVEFLCGAVGVEKVRLTGGEPLERSDLCEVIRSLRGIPQIREVCMTTNGQNLASEAQSLKEAGLDRVNISLDSLREDTFRRITGGSLYRTLDGIHAAFSCGLTPVRINVVLMRGVNDREIADFVYFAIRIGVEVRFIELMRAGPAAQWHNERFFPAAALQATLQEHFNVTELGKSGSGPASLYQVRGQGSEARVGIIAPVTRPFCNSCQRLRLDSQGRLYSCLMSPRRLSLVEILESSGSGPQTHAALHTFLSHKRQSVKTSRGALVSIGG